MTSLSRAVSELNAAFSNVPLTFSTELKYNPKILMEAQEIE